MVALRGDGSVNKGHFHLDRLMCQWVFLALDLFIPDHVLTSTGVTVAGGLTVDVVKNWGLLMRGLTVDVSPSGATDEGTFDGSGQCGVALERAGVRSSSEEI